MNATTKKILAGLMALTMSASLAACGTDTPATPAADSSAPESSSEAPVEERTSDAKTVGIAMPTKSLERWNRDGEYLKQQFEAAGYNVELKYSDNDTNQQNNDIQGMIADGVSLLLIAAIDGNTLSQTLDDAKNQNIPVIAVVLDVRSLLFR